MVSNKKIVFFLCILIFLPSYPFSVVKTFLVPFVFIVWIFFKWVFNEISISKAIFFAFLANSFGLITSAIIGSADLIALAKEFLRANILLLFLLLMGRVSNFSKYSLTNVLWGVFLLNLFLIVCQVNQLQFTILYTQINAEDPFFRPGGFLGNPNLTAFFISVFLLFFSFERNYLNKFFAVLISIVSGLLLQSRSGLSIILLSGLYVLLVGLSNQKKIIFIGVIFLALSLLATFSTTYNYAYDSGGKLDYLMSAFKAENISDISSIALRLENWSFILSRMASFVFGGALYENTLIVDSEYIYTYTHRGVYGFIIYIFIFYYVYVKLAVDVRKTWLFLTLIIMICSIQAETISSIIHATIIGLAALFMSAYTHNHQRKLK